MKYAILLLFSSLLIIELVHTHANKTGDLDVHGTVRKFCKENPGECEEFISDYLWGVDTPLFLSYTLNDTRIKQCYFVCWSYLDH